MTRTSRTQPDAYTETPPVPAAGVSTVMSVAVRVVGQVPVRLDLAHAGTREQQLGLSIGPVLLYLRAAVTAEAVAKGWGSAAPHAQTLGPARVLHPSMRPLGPSSVAAMVRLGGVPRVTAALQPRRDLAPAMVRIQVGPVLWEVLDETAYATILRAWKHAAQLLHTGD